MSLPSSATARAADLRGPRPDDSDRQWVEGIRAGDARSLERLYYAYTSELYAFALHFLKAEDAAWEVVNDVFVRIWRRRAHWRPRGPLRPYLFEAVRNQMYSHLRRVRAHRRVFAPDAPVAGGRHNHTPHQDLETNELSVLIWRFVAEMPERRRMVYYLHRQHGLTYNEIAQVMGIAPSTVDNHMGRALKELRERLAGYL